MLLIGSRAAKEHYPEFREPKDWDLLATPDELTKWVRHNKADIVNHRIRPDNVKAFVLMKSGDKLEVEFARPGNSSMLFTRINHRRPLVAIPGWVAKLPEPSTLMAVKRSHLHQPIRWEKSIDDYHFFKGKGVTLGEEEIAAKELRTKEIDARYHTRRVSLNKTNEEFFAQSEKSLTRVYEHDDLHLATCHYDRPLYESLKPDATKAYLSVTLFNRLDSRDKIRLVQEEAYAIALERWVIPDLERGVVYSPSLALEQALRRICTDLTKGWFRDFAIENYPEIVGTVKDYVANFSDAVYSGKIRRKSS